MTSNVSTACPICRQTTTAELYRCHVCVTERQFQRYMDGDGTRGQESEPFWHCRGCGFVFRVGKLSESVLASYSDKPLREEDILAGIKAHYQDRMTSGKLKRLDWLETQCKFRNVLDVGAGSGELVKILRDRGYQATGIDPDKDRIRLANQLFGLAMQTGFYTDMAYETSQFDLIVCECVLYRFPNPDVFFQAAWKHLRPGGHVFLLVPDVSLVQLNFLTNSVRCLYSPETIKPLLASRGFRLVSLLLHADAPEALQPGNFAVVAQKVEPSTVQWAFTGKPDRETAYNALLKQDYGLLRSRAVWPGAVAILKAIDDLGLYGLGRIYSRSITLAARMLSVFS